MSNLLKLAFGGAQQEPAEDQSVLEHAAHLGMDPGADQAHLWLAKESLFAPLPEGWRLLQTEDGDPYYWNEAEELSQWEHPKDEYYRRLYRQHKAEEQSLLTSRSQSTEPDFQHRPCTARELSGNTPPTMVPALDLSFQPLLSPRTARSLSPPPALMLSPAQSALMWDNNKTDLILQSARYEGEIATLKNQLEVARNYRSPTAPSTPKGMNFAPEPEPWAPSGALDIEPEAEWTEDESKREEANVSSFATAAEGIAVLEDKVKRLSKLKTQLETQNADLQGRLLDALRRATKAEADLEELRKSANAKSPSRKDDIRRLKEKLEQAVERADSAERALQESQLKATVDALDLDDTPTDDVEELRLHDEQSSRRRSPKRSPSLRVETEEFIPSIATKEALSPIRSPLNTEAAIGTLRDKARRKIDSLKKKIADIKSENKSLLGKIEELELSVENLEAEKQRVVAEVDKMKEEVKEARRDRMIAREEVAQLRALQTLVQESAEELERSSLGGIVDAARDPSAEHGKRSPGRRTSVDRETPPVEKKTDGKEEAEEKTTKPAPLPTPIDTKEDIVKSPAKDPETGWAGLLDQIEGALKSCFFYRRSPKNKGDLLRSNNVYEDAAWVANEEQLSSMLEELIVIVRNYTKACPKLEQKGITLGKNEELEKLTRDKDAEVAELRKRLGELEAELKEASSNSSEKEGELADKLRALQQELDRAARENQDAVQNLERTQEDLKRDKASVDSELASKAREIQDLQRENDRAKRAAGEAQQALEDKKKRVEKVEDKLARAKQSIVEYKQQEEQAVKMFEELEKELDAQKAETKQAKEDSAQKSKELRQKAEQLHQVEAELQTTTQRVNDLSDKSKVLVERILELQGNIRVFCRIRPLSEQERTDEAVRLRDGREVQPEETIEYVDDDKFVFHGSAFEFDRIFSPRSSQGSVFAEVEHAVAKAMDGFRVCIFAYGQTGSGKTYTMEGPPDNRGVNWRALSHLFDLASASASGDATSFKVSMLEVYNERIRDLLAPPDTPGADDLDVRVHGGGGGGGAGPKRKGPGKGVFVEGLIEVEVNNVSEVEEIMSLGSENRSTASNNVNVHSSRSHLVLQVKVLRRGAQHGLLSLIDLAGSERLKNTSAQGQRLKEAQNINKSLSSLGDVIAALGSSQRHVPYRNSKLTFLLQDSLGPSSKVLMFVNINPAVDSAGESLCSLNFASRCRAVQLGQAKRVGSA